MYTIYRIAMRIHEKLIKTNNILSVYNADSLPVGLLSFPLGAAKKNSRSYFLSSLSVLTWLVNYWHREWAGYVCTVSLRDSLDTIVMIILRLNIPKGMV